MVSSPETVNIAMFCDFENVALGVRDAKYEKFDIKPVLERLLLKGSIVVKKAYCDWERYKGFKAVMHEANFELIEIPHVRQSGKNSADIRMVVDALDLCYTKSHVNAFVIVSGDSDFSPLVSKLRENAKYVIGVGIRQSTSDLLIANCDEFIFYDDLVRESQRSNGRRDAKATLPRLSTEEYERRKSEAVELAAATFDALSAERGESGKIWASMLKEAMKRRQPHFNESHFGFRSFGNLLEEAQARGLLEVGRDEKSGAFVFRSTGGGARSDTPASAPVVRDVQPVPQVAAVVSAPTASPASPSLAEPGTPSSGRTSPETVPAANRRRGRGRGTTAKNVEAGGKAETAVRRAGADAGSRVKSGEASEVVVTLASGVKEETVSPLVAATSSVDVPGTILPAGPVGNPAPAAEQTPPAAGKRPPARKPRQRRTMAKTSSDVSTPEPDPKN